MFRNLAAAAWRAACRDRLYASLNVLGLGLGLSAVIVIGLFVRDELSFDSTLPGYQDIYRIQITTFGPRQPAETIDNLSHTMAAELKLDFPEIEHIARFSGQNVGVRHGEIEANEDAVPVDPDFFATVPLKLSSGDAATALRQPDEVVLSATLARKYFGTLDCVGNSLELDHAHTVRVVGVLADTRTTNFPFDMMISGISNWSRLSQEDAQPRPPQGDLNTDVQTLVRFKPGTDVAGLRERLDRFVAAHYPPDPQYPDDSFRLWPRPLKELHLAWMNPDTAPNNAPLDTLWAVGAVGALTLFVAGMNFVNLMTARASRRAVEVGVRKALGATQQQLVRQFMGESVAYALAALVLASAAVELLLPTLNAFLHRTIAFAYWRDPSLAAAMLALTLLLGLSAGAYPALVQASFRPAATLKGGRSAMSGSGRLRQALVILQFMVSIGLLIATAVIYRQTQFATHESLRFDTDQIVTIELDALPGIHAEQHDTAMIDTLKDRIGRLAGVRGVTGSWLVPAAHRRSTDRVIGVDTPDHSDMQLDRVPVDFDFFKVYGMAAIAGRDFDRAHGDAAAPVTLDTPLDGEGTAILNEAAVRRLGFTSPAAAIGHHFRYPGDNGVGGQVREIVGVMPDLQLATARDTIRPTAFLTAPGWDDVLSVKLAGSDIPETLQQIDRIWHQIVPARPIDRVFLDERIEKLYLDLEREGGIFAAFALVAVAIGCLGLFGLSAFTAERRTKEIGIRKALGASVFDVVRLLVWQFSRPVLIANLLAWPIAWFVMRRWLDGFAYRIELGPQIFLVAGLGAIAIAIATTAFHAVKVARARPVLALRYE